MRVFLVPHRSCRVAPLKMYNMCLSLQYLGNISQLAPDLGGRMECREGWRWHALIPVRLDPPFFPTEGSFWCSVPPTDAGLTPAVFQGRPPTLIMEFQAAVRTSLRPQRVRFSRGSVTMRWTKKTLILQRNLRPLPPATGYLIPAVSLKTTSWTFHSCLPLHPSTFNRWVSGF